MCLTHHCSLPLRVCYVEYKGWWLEIKKNHNLWHECHYCTFSIFSQFVPYFTICAMHHVSVLASGRNQPSTPVRVSDRKSMSRLQVPEFCLFSTKPLSANAIMPFIDFSTDSQQPTHIQFTNNA